MRKQVLLQLCLIVGAGAGLLALGIGLGRSRNLSSNATSGPVPTAVRIPTRAFFTANLQPYDQSRDETLKSFEAKYGGLDFNLGKQDHVRTSFRTMRTIQNGSIFDSQSVLEWVHRNDGTGHAVLNIAGPGKSSRDFRLGFVGNKPNTLSARFDNKEVITETKDLHALPVIIGDLNIQDHFDLVSSVRDRRYQVLGELHFLNARPQLVLSVELGDASANLKAGSNDQVDEDESRPVSALIMLDAETSELRSVRFFDVEGALVRTYSDFSSNSRVSNLPFNYFRIDSVRTGNATVIIIDDMKTEAASNQAQ
jgi:hypothetical protein